MLEIKCANKNNGKLNNWFRTVYEKTCMKSILKTKDSNHKAKIIESVQIEFDCSLM